MGCEVVQVRSMASQPAVMVIECARERVFRTQSIQSNSADEYVLTGQELESLGPALQDIVVHSECSDITQNFSYKFQLQWKYNNGGWQSVDLSPFSTSGGYTITVPFADRTTFGIRVRVVMLCFVEAGGSGDVVEQATMNISVAARLYNGV